MLIAGIDPGLSGTGIVVLDTDHGFVLVEAFTIPSRLGLEFRVQTYGAHTMNSMWVEINKTGIKGSIVRDFPKVVIIEQPVYWSASARGKFATSSSGLIKMGMVIGSITQAVAPYNPVVMYVSPNKWKGNLSKTVTHERTLKVLKKDKIWPQFDSIVKTRKEHALDAAGIALWYKEDLKRQASTTKKKRSKDS